jgi:hypothetical protein
VNLGADRSPHLDDADLLGDFSNLLIGNFSRINRTGLIAGWWDISRIKPNDCVERLRVPLSTKLLIGLNNSSPLGSASKINNLIGMRLSVSNSCPINACVQGWTPRRARAPLHFSEASQTSAAYSVHRELIVFSEEHLRRILGKYSAYYNEVRSHVSLGKDAPCTRPIERFGDIVAHPILGGLHHRYARI